VLCPLLPIVEAFRRDAIAAIPEGVEMFWWFILAGRGALRRWSERRAFRAGGVLNIFLKALALLCITLRKNTARPISSGEKETKVGVRCEAAGTWRVESSINRLFFCTRTALTSRKPGVVDVSARGFVWASDAPALSARIFSSGSVIGSRAHRALGTGLTLVLLLTMTCSLFTSAENNRSFIA
jgi:hypothetical protein